MSRSLRLWDRLPFVARLLAAAGLALLVAGGALLYAAVRGDAEEATLYHQLRLDGELYSLPASVADLVVLGDYAALQQNLDAQVRRAGVQRLSFRDAGNVVLSSADAPIVNAAPAWFVRWMALEELSGDTEVRVGGRYYGTLEVMISPQAAINRTWQRLLRYLGVLGIAIAFGLFAVWLVLRLGLRPLHALERGSQALAAGRYDLRLAEVGSPELRHVIQAFNHMAAEVQATVQSLSTSEGRVSAILQSIGDGLIATDGAMRVTYLNPVAESLTGWTQSEVLGRSVAEIMRIEHALTRVAAEIPVGRVLETGRVVGLANHTVLVARDGRRYHISDSAAPIRDAGGALVGVVMVFRDVSESYQLRSELEESQGRLALALKGADLGLWDWRVLTGQVVYDQRWASMLGYDSGEIEPVFATWEHLVHPDDLPVAKRALDDHMAGRVPQYEAEVRMRAKDGTWRWVLTRGRVTERDAQGRVTRVTGTHLDTTEQHGAREEVERLAFYDPLTGLPNRRLFMDRLRQEFAAAQRNRSCGALLFIDLDHFKRINDARGHAVGDQILKQAAQRLAHQLRKIDTVARIGGDEFVVLLPALAEDQTAAATAAGGVADKLRTSLGELYTLEGEGEHYLGVSIGVAVFPDVAQGDCETLLRHADTAMYRAKEAGRNTVCFFAEEMQTAVQTRLALAHDLRKALARQQFQLHFQAQHDRHGEIVGAEVLLRWLHPQRGMMPPSLFIPLAEESGLIVPIGEWVLTQCAALLKALECAGRNLRLAVNVSPRQFKEADFVHRVQTILGHSGASPQRLVLEITEGMLMDDVGPVIARMAELERLGVLFSIDDFGTGFSSLSYLKRLPLHELKIDRAFVAGLPRDGDDASLVEVILLIAHQMGMQVVAEGVETEAQHAWLKAEGCDCFQGYLLGRPEPEPEFLARLGLSGLERPG